MRALHPKEKRLTTSHLPPSVSPGSLPPPSSQIQRTEWIGQHHATVVWSMTCRFLLPTLSWRSAACSRQSPGMPKAAKLDAPREILQRPSETFPNTSQLESICLIEKSASTSVHWKPEVVYLGLGHEQRTYKINQQHTQREVSETDLSPKRKNLVAQHTWPNHWGHS